MAGEPAAHAYFHLERCEVELVMKDGESFDIELVEAKRLLNRVAAVVHEGLGLDQQDAVPAQAPLRYEAPEFLLPGAKAMDLGDNVDRHEPDIVPMECILRAGISEADPELHARSLACAQRKKKPPAGKGERFLVQKQDRAYSPPPSPCVSPSPSGSSPSSTVGTSPAAAVSSSSAFIADGATIVATVKSSSWFAAVTPSGSFTWLIWIESPISSPSSGTWISLGMLAASQTSSSSCTTAFKTPPRFKPGEASSLSNRSGTATCTLVCSPIRRKSTWIGRLVTGWKSTALGKVRCGLPERSIITTEFMKCPV